MKIKNLKFFITDAEGFIGFHLVERLLKFESNVFALVLNSFNNDILNLINWKLKYNNKKKIKKSIDQTINFFKQNIDKNNSDYVI